MLPEYLRSYLCTLTAIDIIRYQNLFSFIYTQMIIYSEYEINSYWRLNELRMENKRLRMHDLNVGSSNVDPLATD